VVSWLPNLLTAARLAAVVPFSILLARAPDGVSTTAAVLFIVIASTDFLDGYLARHLGAQTRFGRIADPLADRLLVDVTIILLVLHDRLAWWLAVPVLLRDALLAALFRARHAETDVRVNMLGKTATALFMVSLALLMLTERDWPIVLYVIGMVCSLAAGLAYYRTAPQGGLE
jgi:cardiolipin synthase